MWSGQKEEMMKWEKPVWPMTVILMKKRKVI